MGCISGTGRRWLSKKLDLCSFCAFLFALFHKNVVSLWTFMLSYRRLYIVVCLALVLVSVVACSNNETEMRRQLSELQACNQADSLMTNDSLAIALCEYFDHHGTANEQMMAHYLLGRTYADLGEAPQAIESFHNAISCADTTDVDCDYALLCRVHVQSADVLYAQNLPAEALDEYKQGCWYAKRSNDTLAYLTTYAAQHLPYYTMGITDSAITVLLDAAKLCENYGKQELALSCYEILPLYMVEEKRFEEAKNYFNLCRSWFNKSEIPVSYYIKGMFQIAFQQPDSAVSSFRHMLLIATDANDKEGAYKVLYHAYKAIGKADSVAKYADLCYCMSDTSFRETNTNELRNMHSLYNYSRQQQLALSKEQEAYTNYRLFLTTLFVSIIVAILLGSLLFIIRHHRYKQLKSISQEYNAEIEQLEQAKYDLAKSYELELSEFQKQKEKEVKERQAVIDGYKKLLSTETTLEKRLGNQDICKHLHYLASHPTMKAKKKDWQELRSMIERELPSFYSSLNNGRHVCELDYHLSILIRLHFNLSEISTLLDLIPAELSRRRKSLLKKWYDKDGSPKDFDRIIQLQK